MEILTFFITPIIGGLIALSTNWLAIRMLFRPHKEVRIFGIKLPFTPGLIPKERVRLTDKLAEAVSTKLLTPDVLARDLSNPTLWPLPDLTIGEALAKNGISTIQDLAEPVGGRIKALVKANLANVLSAVEGFDEKLPALDEKLKAFTFKVIDENVSGLASIFISKEKIYKSIKTAAVGYLVNPENFDEIEAKILDAVDAVFTSERMQEILLEKVFSFHIKNELGPLLEREQNTVKNIIAAAAGYLAAHMPVKSMIENKMADLDVAEIERIVLSVTGRELKVIVLLGGVLGFIIGLIAVLI